MVIMSFKAQTNIKLKHSEEKDKKVGKFKHLCRNLINCIETLESNNELNFNRWEEKKICIKII